MERIKKLRTPQRAVLTKVVQAAEQELVKAEKSHQFLQERWEQLQRVMTELRQLDGRYREAMLDGNATEEEILEELERIEEYEVKFASICNRINQELHPEMKRPPSPAQSDYTAVSGSETKKRTFKLPKIELRKFNAELKEWLSWWAQFQKIHEDESLHESDKFHYLIQAMEVGTEGRDIVCSYPQSAENYPKAIGALKERFGRESLLLQVYIRELLQLVIHNVNAKEKMPMDKLYLKLESHLRSLSTLNLATADPATWLFPLVESSLPEEVLRAWQRNPMSKKDGAKEDPKKTSLEILMEFVKTEVQAEQQISLARSGFREESIEQKGEAEHIKTHKTNANLW